MAATRQRILITGASSGLGAEMARQFAAKGRDLALLARRTDRLDELKASIAAAHPSVRVVTAELDVNDHDAVFATFPRVADELGGLDRVIVNAGIGKGVPVGTGGFRPNRETLETNLVAALAQAEAAVQMFRAAGSGHLVLVSSVAALRGFPGDTTAYAASKAGLLTLGEGIRAELHGTGIAVTTLLPGFIKSELAGDKQPLIVDTDKGVRAMVKAIEAESHVAAVPALPWKPVGVVLRYAPDALFRKVIAGK